MRGSCLVVHDIFGLHTGRHVQLCDELAAEGYVAVCPDCFRDGRARAEAALLPRWPIKQACNILEMLCCCKFTWMVRPPLPPCYSR